MRQVNAGGWWCCPGLCAKVRVVVVVTTSVAHGLNPPTQTPGASPPPHTPPHPHPHTPTTTHPFSFSMHFINLAKPAAHTQYTHPPSRTHKHMQTHTCCCTQGSRSPHSSARQQRKSGACIHLLSYAPCPAFPLLLGCHRIPAVQLPAALCGSETPPKRTLKGPRKKKSHRQQAMPFRYIITLLFCP